MWLNKQQELINQDINQNITNVLKHGQFIMGPEVKELEEILADYIGCRYAIGCSSGTDALLLALLAHGVGPETIIFTTPFTFISTAEVAALLGATVAFVDIDPVTFNIDPKKLEEQLSMMRLRQPAGLIAVDLFGLPADYERLNSICESYEMFCIEDAAQSFGGEMFGKKAGNLTTIGCTSFFPSKPLGCYGDGGMCFTNNMTFKHIMESIRVHGKGKNKYDNKRIGLNARLDTIQAAILLSKFKIFRGELEMKQIIAESYHTLLKSYDIELPLVPTGFKSAWAQFSILAKNEEHRETLRNKLINKGFDAPIYYPKPLHLQDAFRYLCYSEGTFPISEDYSKRIFSLPMHPYLTIQDQKRIVEVLR